MRRDSPALFVALWALCSLHVGQVCMRRQLQAVNDGEAVDRLTGRLRAARRRSDRSVGCGGSGGAHQRLQN